MAKRSRRRTGARGASGIRQSLNEAQRAVGGYVRSGSKQVNDAVSTFLSKFDTGHLLDALRKKMRGTARTGGRRRSTATSRRSAAASRRRTGSKVRRAAASKRPAMRRSSRRK
jgi:hypothetical protein